MIDELIKAIETALQEVIKHRFVISRRRDEGTMRITADNAPAWQALVDNAVLGAAMRTVTDGGWVYTEQRCVRCNRNYAIRWTVPPRDVMTYNDICVPCNIIFMAEREER